MINLKSRIKNHQSTICVIGLGYVGLPLAIEFAKKYPTIGFDLNKERIKQLKESIDITFEVDKKELNAADLTYITDAIDITDFLPRRFRKV